MTRLVRAEWLKLRTVVSNQVLLVIAAVGGIGLGVLVAVVIPVDEILESVPTPSDLFSLSLAGLGVTYALVSVLGVQVITQEFRFTGRATFAAEPRRLRVLLAKMVTLVVAGVVIGAAVVGVSLVGNGAILDARGIDVGFGFDGFWRATVGAVVLVALNGLVGFGFGAIVRSPAVAITTLVVWNLIVEPVVTAIVPEVGQWLPFQAGGQLALPEPTDPGVGPVVGGLLFTGVALALVVVGGWLTVRRDA